MAEPAEWSTVSPEEFCHVQRDADGRTAALTTFTASESGWYRYDSETGFRFLGPDTTTDGQPVQP